MNAYQVIWRPREWRRLHEMADRSNNRASVAAAHATIQQALGTDPHRNGTPLSEGLWKFDSGPLRVCFSIDSPRRRVVIRYVFEIA